MALPSTTPDGDQSSRFEQLLKQLRGADVVLFPDLAAGDLDRFFHLRLAQLLRREPPLPALSVVGLSPGLRKPDLAGGFADRFSSGWPFEACVFVTLADDAAPLSTRLGLPVERPDTVWTPLHSFARASQKTAVQFQLMWNRCGSTTGFENQVESLVRAGFLTIRLFADATSRRGETLTARLAQIIPENNEHAGAHIDAVAVPDGPPIPIRGRNHDSHWATLLAATAMCRVRDGAIAEAARRADSAVANHLECVGPALALAPRARLMLDVRDDRARQIGENLRRAGRDDAEVEIAVAAASRAQAAVLAIPDICGHVSATEFERLGRQSQRAAIVRPRPYMTQAAEPTTPRFDVLVFGDQHPFNIASLRWFLEEVWHPHLAAARVSVAIAGRVGHHARDLGNGSPLLHFLGFVEDLDAVRSVSRLTVVPDRQGTGTAVKTLATLAAGHPLVSTSVGIRGLDQAASGLLPARDDPAALAADILDLLRDPDRLAGRRRLVQQAQTALRRGPDHAALLRWIPRPTPRVRRLRAARWARLTAAAIVPDKRRYVFASGVWFPMSGSAWDQQVLLDGWHGAETWGRWSDGAEASLRITLADPAADELTLELDIAPSPVGALLSLTVDDAGLGSLKPVPGSNTWDIPMGLIRGKSSFVVGLHVSETARPALSGGSSETRILGIGTARMRLVRR